MHTLVVQVKTKMEAETYLFQHRDLDRQGDESPDHDANGETSDPIPGPEGLNGLRQKDAAE